VPHKLVAKDLMEIATGVLVEELDIAARADASENPRAPGLEPMILNLRLRGVGCDLTQLDERAERERSTFLGEEIPSQWVKTVGRRANMTAGVGVHPCDADTWRVHPGEVAENDPHRIESQVHRSYV
jgi:hypothetical protein